MKFKSTQIKGKGRGKLLGFPTINLEIPDDLKLKTGIYAINVYISGNKYLGAMHYGPIPVFSEDSNSLEIFLIDTEAEHVPDSDIFEVETVKYLRPVLNFPNQEELAKQIAKDVEYTKEILSF